MKKTEVSDRAQLEQLLYEEAHVTAARHNIAEPCNEDGTVTYHAAQRRGTVHLIATGHHPTAGYRVLLTPTAIDVFPPEFALKHILPEGPAPDVETPFHVAARFLAEEPVKAVVVHDVQGKQVIPVLAHE